MKRRILIVAAFVGIMLVPAACGRGYSGVDDEGCYTVYSGSNRTGYEVCNAPLP